METRLYAKVRPDAEQAFVESLDYEFREETVPVPIAETASLEIDSFFFESTHFIG